MRVTSGCTPSFLHASENQHALGNLSMLILGSTVNNWHNKLKWLFCQYLTLKVSTWKGDHSKVLPLLNITGAERTYFWATTKKKLVLKNWRRKKIIMTSKIIIIENLPVSKIADSVREKPSKFTLKDKMSYSHYVYNKIKRLFPLKGIVPLKT